MPNSDGLGLISDEPIEELTNDLLNFGPLAQAIASIGLKQPGPFTIGVFGGWGSGKTSLMRLVQSIINAEGREDLVTVWFNAWQYEREEHPIIPLVGSILKTVESNEAVAARAGKGFLDALRSVAYGFSIKGLGIEFDAARAIDREAELASAPVDALLDASLYFKAFDLLKEQQGKIKVVVFVDDLDRCMPDKAVALLEAVKLVLSEKGFVFVLGVARRVLDDFLVRAYKRHGVEQAGLHGRSYLDKLVQAPFRIPTGSLEFKACVEQLLTHIGLFNGKPPGEARLSYRELLVEQLLPYFAAVCEARPRSAKRILNNIGTWVFLWKLREQSDIPVDELALRSVDAAIQQYDFEMYRDLVEDRPELAETLLAELQSGTGTEIPGQAVEDEEQRLHEDLAGLEWYKRVRNNQPVCSFLLSDWGRLWLERGQQRETVGKSSPFEPVRETRPTLTESIRDAIQRACEAADCASEDLTSLDLRNTRGADWGNLPHLPALEALDVRDCGITNDHLEMIAGKVSGKLRKLVLNSNVIGNEGLDVLLQLGGLAELYLSNNSVTDAGIAKLTALSSLTRIDLERDRITDAGLESLGKLTGLWILNLMRTDVTDLGLPHLVGLNQLKKLYLSRTTVGDEGLRWLGECDAVSGLEALLLERTLVSSAGVAHIAGLSHLDTLRLRDCRGVNDSALDQLRAATNLDYLDVSGTMVTSAGIDHVATLPHLSTLLIARTRVDDTGIQALQRLAAVHTLDLGQCRITDAGAAQLSAMTGLRVLDLNNTELTDACVEHMSKLKGLQKLNLKGTQVSAAGLSTLREALPRTVIKP